MKAIAFHGFGNQDVLKLIDLPIPEAGPGEVVVKVRAAGVNPVDWKIREGYLRDALPHKFPIVPGWDMAGHIESTGPGVTRLRAGDEVFAYCRKPVVQLGSYCEFMTLPEQSVALKPVTVSFEEAASIPLAGLTAYQALFDCADLRAGETVLVHAAAGGVGGFAVQLAKDRGAIVIGTCSADNAAYVKSLGADLVVDYTRKDFRQEIRASFPSGIELVFDCVGGETLERSQEILKPHGRLISIVDSAPAFKIRSDISFQYVFVQPDASQLKILADMVEEKRLATSISAVMPLEEAKQALTISQSGKVRGKIVLKVC